MQIPWLLQVFPDHFQIPWLFKGPKKYQHKQYFSLDPKTHRQIENSLTRVLMVTDKNNVSS